MAERTASITLELHDRASGPLREVIAAMKEALGLARELRGALGVTATSFGQVGGAARTMDGSVRQAAQGFGLLQKAASATYYFLLYQAFAQVQRGITGFIEANQRADAVLRQLTASTGSAVRGKQEFDRVWSYALKSPFTVEQLGEADKLMVNLRIDTQKWLPLVSQLAIATSDLGKGTEAANERLLRAVRIVSLLQGGTAQTGLLLRRLEPLGIGRRDILAPSERVGAFAVDQHGKLLASADEMMRKLEDIITRRFGDVNKSLEGSFVVTVSNMQDSFKRMAVSIGTEVFPTIQRDLQAVLGGLVGPDGQLTQQAKDAAQGIGDFSHALYIVMKSEWQLLFGTIGTLIDNIFGRVHDTMGQLTRLAQIASTSGIPGVQTVGGKLLGNIRSDQSNAVALYQQANTLRIGEVLAGQRTAAVPFLPPEFSQNLGANLQYLQVLQGMSGAGLASKMLRAGAQGGITDPNGVQQSFGSVAEVRTALAAQRQLVAGLIQFGNDATRAIALQAGQVPPTGPAAAAAQTAAQKKAEDAAQALAAFLQSIQDAFHHMMPQSAQDRSFLAINEDVAGVVQRRRQTQGMDPIAGNPAFLEAMFGGPLPTSWDETRHYNPLAIDKKAMDDRLARMQDAGGGNQAAYVKALTDQLAVMKKINATDPWRTMDPDIRKVQKELNDLNHKELREMDRLAQRIAAGIGAAFAQFVVGVVTGTQKMTEALRQLKQQIAQLALEEGLRSLFKGIASAVPGGGAALAGIGALLSILPFASGIRDVPRDQIAYLHKGESVVPAGVAVGGGGGSTTQITEHTTIYALDAQSFDDYWRTGAGKRTRQRATRHGYAA